MTRAAVESATNIPVGTVSASVIWLAPSSANDSPMIAVRIVSARRRSGTASLASISGRRSGLSFATCSVRSGGRH